MKKRKLNKLVGEWKPWDYGFSLEVEKEMFRKQAEYFSKCNIAVGDKERGNKCKLLVKLIDIIIHNDSAIRIYYQPETNDIGKVITETIWESTKYINIRNANRFFKKECF